MKKVAILQSNYMPWKGYFDIISQCDLFIIYDEVQYTKNDWRNRNQIKTKLGIKWLTIPVVQKFKQSICDAQIASDEWAEEHYRALQMNYARAPFFKQYQQAFEAAYALVSSERLLSRVNYFFLKLLCELLDIKTPIIWSSDYPTSAYGKTERLIELLQAVSATAYVSGPAAKNYLNEYLFHEAGIDLHFMNYGYYKPYPQLHGDFTHAVSIVDVLFNIGADALQYVKSNQFDRTEIQE